VNTMQDEPIEQQELHDYLLRVPLFDGQGNVVDSNGRTRSIIATGSTIPLAMSSDRSRLPDVNLTAIDMA